MLKLFIACVALVFVAHHRIMNQMLGNIATLSKNATQFNETVHTCLHHLEVTSEIAMDNFDFVKYLKKRVDAIDLRMAALENTINLEP
tara:strand:- start:151 stop:414 length:264 start_codon:yes stop_codon:yes gene_type:complete